MNKNIIMATSILSSVIPTSINTQSYAMNDLENLTQNTRTLTEINKAGKVTGVKSNDVLNVRKEPNADSSLVFTLKNSTEITVLAQDSKTNWYKISYDGKEGYASNRYIEITGDLTTTYNVTADINLRKSASWSGEVITVVKKGSKLNVISINNGWAKVNYNGTVCYAPSQHLEEIGITTPTPSTPSSPSTPESSNTIKYRTTSDINLRKSSSWSGEVLTVVKKGTELNVVSVANGWAKVNYDGTTCYAPESHLEKVGTATTPSTPDNSQGNTNTYNVTGDINLRETASWSGKVITVIKKGASLNVISIDGNWAKVNYNRTICYAPSNYLEKVNSTETPDIPTTPEVPSTPEVDKTLIATVNTDGLNIRAGAGMSYSILAKANKGDVVLLKENKSTNGWYKVELTNGIVGWCYEDYLDNIREGELPAPPSNDDNTSSDSYVESGQIATVNTNGLNIRSGSSTIYPILSVLNKGDKVLIMDKDSTGWYKVKLTNGVVGWCNGAYLEDFKSGSITINPDGQNSSSSQELINKVISVAKEQIGKPYKYGSAGPSSFDCSGLTYYAYKNGANITLPRNSSAQAGAGKYVSKSELQIGDLVFFNTSGSGISHVGIYVGNNEMLHAPSSGKTVQIVSMNQSYWNSRYVTARRIIY